MLPPKLSAKQILLNTSRFSQIEVLWLEVELCWSTKKRDWIYGRFGGAGGV
jgi:hypothetical protein